MCYADDVIAIDKPEEGPSEVDKQIVELSIQFWSHLS